MIGFEYVNHLASIGAFGEGKARVLDIGSQNLMLAEADAIVEFARRFGATLGGKALRDEAERIAYFSTPRPGERTSYLSELFDLTSIEYTSFDVCPALKTEIFDLNLQQLDPGRRETFDVVINCGTAEHVLNQLNCFSVMHDALKPGGIWFDQPPCVGFVNHGYFLYHPKFYRDIATANDYEVEDMWYSPAGLGPVLDDDIPIRPYETLHQMKERTPTAEEAAGPYYNLNVILRKTRSGPFRLPLELETSHAEVDQGVAERYAGLRTAGDKTSVSRTASSPTRFLRRVRDAWRHWKRP